jgi:site-specific DNA-methyltransferase (adenine-specific)
LPSKAPRNKTIQVSGRDVHRLTDRAVVLKEKTTTADIVDKVIWQDSLKAMDKLPDACVDLMIADPPYNLTKNFSSSVFREMKNDDYAKWLDRWLKKTVRLLKDNASIYICADWKTSIAIPYVAGKYFVLQNRISWEREKGRGAKNNWKNCLEDIWFFTKSKDYKFNLDNVKILKPVIAPYRNDEGAPKDWFEKENQKMRFTHPSNVWTDISVPFWSMSENTNHPTQKPEKLIAKLILASSDENDLVFDPFLGSGTTAVVAKKLKRHFLGIEKEKEYVALSLLRLDMADANPQIQGFENGIFKPRNQ